MLLVRLFLAFPLLFLFFQLLKCTEQKEKSKVERISIKIVENPAKPIGTGFSSWNQPKKLNLRVPPAPFSGPLPWKSLLGRCFILTEANYKYELCPFHNITQREVSYRWNSYAGVLGVWKEWSIVNNTFDALVMTDGDDCGENNVLRQTKVLLVCAKATMIAKVSEPQTCQYEVVLKSPLACDRRNVNVYYWLAPSQRRTWDNIEQDYHFKDLTKQGYQKQLRQLFRSAGFVDGRIQESGGRKPDKDVSTSDRKEASTVFSDLEICKMEYAKLEIELRNLKIQLGNSTVESAATVTNATQAEQSQRNTTIGVIQTAGQNSTVEAKAPNATAIVNSTSQSDIKPSPSKKVKLQNKV